METTVASLRKLKTLGSKKITITNWSISQKIIFVTVAVVIASGIIGTAYQTRKLTDTIIDHQVDHVTRFARQVEVTIEKNGQDISHLQNNEQFREELETVAKTEKIDELLVTSKTGEIIAHNKEGYVGSKYTNPDLRQAMTKNKKIVTTESHPNGAKKVKRIAITVPLRVDDKVVGALEAEFPLTLANNLTISFGKTMTLPILAIALFVVPFMLAFLMRYVSHPIRDLLQATESIVKQDLDVKVRINSSDEIGQLAQSFNKMTEILKKSREHLKYRIKELSIISEVSRVTSSTLDLEETLQLVLDNALKVLEAEFGSIMLLDEDKEELRIKVARGLDEKTIKKARVRLGKGISGWVAKEGEPLLLFNSIKNGQFEGVKENIRDAICAPLKTKQRTIGVINASNKLKGNFTHSDIDLLSTLANEAASAIENAQLFETLHSLYLNTVEALAAAVDAKDPYTHGHSGRVAEYSKEIAKVFDLSSRETQAIQSAAYLHDIGKIGIPEKILRKVGRLSSQEYALVKTHPDIAAKILSPIKFPWEVLSPIKEHHQYLNGGGYPNGNKRGEISLGAKIIAVADAFDAMTSSRPYRRALSLKEAIDELERYAGTQFDKEVVEVFVKILKKKLNKSAKSGD